MFGALTQGSTIYVLDKTSSTPVLKVATVSASTQPTGFNAGSQWMQPILGAGQTVDINVSYPDGESSKFERLPANGSVFAYDKAVVTETRELMQQQVEASMRQSKSIVDSAPFHQQAISAYEEMLRSLSPSYAKEKQTEERLDTLEHGLTDIKSMLSKLVSK